MQDILQTVTAHDGYPLPVKLTLPQAEPKGVVLFVHGTGPNTYDNRRTLDGETTFDYFDLFTRELCGRGLAFCRWCQRGCTPGGEPPLYVQVDEAGFATYLPANCVADIHSVARAMAALPQLAGKPVLLLGGSEGANLAPLAALEQPGLYHGLLLFACHAHTLREVLQWQLDGGASMVNLCKFFDGEGKGYLTRADYDNDPLGLRESMFGGQPFEELDKDGDGRLTRADCGLLLQDTREGVFRAIEQDDNTWLAANLGVRFTAGWCRAHFALPHTINVLAQLTLPVRIFHGAQDANVPVADAEEIKRMARQTGKSNIEVSIFSGHDHDLNYLLWPVQGKVSDGLAALFRAAEQLVQG